MNILSSILSILTWHYRSAEKIATTDSPTSSPVESPEKIKGKMIQHPPDLEVPVQIDPQNLYHPRFLPDFGSDNFNYLSSHPAIKPRLN
ncbi:MAG: hypothetical protein VKK42_10400 [Lyngbya sp.]|nr:hypothetical protein [Lyngbya sp.]